MKFVLLGLLFFNSILVQAEDQRFPFASPEQETRFDHLTEELRCLVCQNQSLADSDAPLANDLRKEVYAMINAGKSDKDIIDFLVARYGEFVLYRPRLTTTTILLWFAPVLLVTIGVFSVIALLRRRSDKNSVSESDLQRVRRLLDEQDQ